MESLLFIASLWLLLLLGGLVYRLIVPQNQSRQTPHPGQHSPPHRSPHRPPPRDGAYRPSPGRHKRVVFPEAGKEGGTARAPTPESLDGLHDAFTGEALNPAHGLHQCTNCKVYYHADSVEVLREANAGRCVACSMASVVALTADQASRSTGRDYSPDVVTLANYHHHFDRVVTFEGLVRSVRVSRRGLDYAVMFEDSSWTRGLKLVFFRGSVSKVGGPGFITALQDRHIRVRGLLIRHPRFGPEIVISESRMILEVR